MWASPERLNASGATKLASMRSAFQTQKATWTLACNSPAMAKARCSTIRRYRVQARKKISPSVPQSKALS
jgi:hypothetical protein